MTTHPTILLHGIKLSGHVHRVELLLRALNLPYEYVQAGAEERASEAFRRLNPLGQIPVLQDGDVTLADSTAILVYLCKRYGQGTAWLPEDPLGAAAVQRWLSLASGEIANGPAKARVALLFKSDDDVARAQAVAQRALAFMEAHLAGRDYLAAPHATIADLACYAYIARAPEGGIALDPYPAVRAWLARVEELPGFVPMPVSA
jgi:glutathione S-transferase